MEMDNFAQGRCRYSNLINSSVCNSVIKNEVTPPPHPKKDGHYQLISVIAYQGAQLQMQAVWRWRGYALSDCFLLVLNPSMKTLNRVFIARLETVATLQAPLARHYTSVKAGSL